jgi:1-acyl-sn-glycerol-3-phosphate acyltransferase
LERSLRVRALHSANRIFARVYHQIDVLAPCLLPRTGRAIIVCNHISGLDPVLIQACTPRLIIWMTAQEYCEQPGLRWLFRSVHAIPVKRGERDLSAMRQALRALADGHVLGIFPEAQLATSHDLLPFQTGAAVLAVRTSTPIYPAAIEGNQRGKDMLPAYLRSHNSRLAFDDPIMLWRNEHTRDPENGTKLLREAVQRLRQRLIPQPVGENINKNNVYSGI